MNYFFGKIQFRIQDFGRFRCFWLRFPVSAFECSFPSSIIPFALHVLCLFLALFAFPLSLYPFSLFLYAFCVFPVSLFFFFFVLCSSFSVLVCFPFCLFPFFCFRSCCFVCGRFSLFWVFLFSLVSLSYIFLLYFLFLPSGLSVSRFLFSHFVLFSLFLAFLAEVFYPWFQ